MVPFFRKKKGSLGEEMPGELGRIRDELNNTRRLPNPEDVSEDELGEPIERSGLPPDLESMLDRPPVHEKKREEREEPRRAHSENDKLDLIISKLDTIDARLRLIEEKMKRF